MKKKKNPISYLRSYRLRWGLSQGELAYLLGWDSSAVVSRLEKKQQPPSAKIVLGCYIIFGTRAAELFPGVVRDFEGEVMARVWDLYEKIQGKPSRKTKTKIELLEDVIARAKERERTSRP